MDKLSNWERNCLLAEAFLSSVPRAEYSDHDVIIALAIGFCAMVREFESCTALKAARIILQVYRRLQPGAASRSMMS